MITIVNFVEILYWISVVVLALSIIAIIIDNGSNEPIVFGSGILIVQTGVLSLLHVLDAIDGRTVDIRLFILLFSLTLFYGAIEFSVKKTKKLWEKLKKDNDDLKKDNDDLQTRHDKIHGKYDLLNHEYSHVRENYELLPKKSVPRETTEGDENK